MIDMNTMDCAAGISYQRADVVTVAAKDMRNTSVALGNLLIRAQEKMAATVGISYRQVYVKISIGEHSRVMLQRECDSQSME